MENLVQREFNADVNNQVKQELQIAGIPCANVGRLEGEVRTCYVGILNGFVFTREWTYWVVKGNMPLEYAKQIYDRYFDLLIRADGHCDNIPPEKCAQNKDFNKEFQPYKRKFYNKEISAKEYYDMIEQILNKGEQVVKTYHIDTQLGLCKFAEFIKDNNIQTEFVD